jgi:uncharacterized protein YkwD
VAIGVLLAGCGTAERTATTATAEAVVWTPAVTTTTAPTLTAADTLTPTVAPQDAAPLTPTSAGAAPTLATVTVASGDTLLGLALDHGVPIAAIQLQNDLGSLQTIRLDQQLTIPSAGAWEGASPFWIIHAVAEGETLSEIAAAYDLTVSDLQDANGLTDADRLGIGQTLVVPLTTFTEPRAVVRTPDPTPAPTPNPATVATAAAALTAPTATVTPVETATVAPAPTATPLPHQDTPVDVGPPAVADWPYETVRIMNEVRAEHGLPPLIYNETLARAGQIQADDCAARGSCSHTGSDGATIKDRVLRVGYDPAGWAECWAIRPTPQEAIDIWMDEVPPNDPHRRTLLTTWLTEIGVGVAEAHWGYYFIAVFGKPLP